MREGRAYLELRAEITGELNKAPSPPNFGLPGLQQLMPGGVNVNGVERMLVIAMPKTAEAEAEERRRLIANGLLPPPKEEVQNPNPALALPPPSLPSSPIHLESPTQCTPENEPGDEEESDDLPSAF